MKENCKEAGVVRKKDVKKLGCMKGDCKKLGCMKGNCK